MKYNLMSNDNLIVPIMEEESQANEEEEEEEEEEGGGAAQEDPVAAADDWDIVAHDDDTSPTRTCIWNLEIVGERRFRRGNSWVLFISGCGVYVALGDYRGNAKMIDHREKRRPKLNDNPYVGTDTTLNV